MVGIEELSYLPKDPKPTNIRGWDYYEIAELALIQRGICPFFSPVASIGLKKIGDSYSLLFSEVAKQTMERFTPFALDIQYERLGNILIYISWERLKDKS